MLLIISPIIVPQVGQQANTYIIMLSKGDGAFTAALSTNFAEQMRQHGITFSTVYLFKDIAVGGEFSMTSTALSMVENVFHPELIMDDSIILLQQGAGVQFTGNWSYFYGGKYTGRNVTIAVIDTGVDYTLSALGGELGRKVIGGYNLVDNSPNPMDTEGHGTAVASIIAANSSSFVGVAPGARILAYKVFQNGETTLSLLIQAIDMAASNGAQIINLSLGGAAEDVQLQQIAYMLSQQGIEIVAAVGNEGPDTYTVSAPADLRGYFAVGASTSIYSNGTSGWLIVNGTMLQSAVPAADSPVSASPIEGKTVYIGNASQVIQSNLTGYIAVALRNEQTYFGVMEANAAAAGAKALIIVNNFNSSLLANLTNPFQPNYKPRIPVLTVSWQDGAFLAVSNASYTARLDVFQANSTVFPAYFSSRGPVNEYVMKPELLAPGDAVPAITPNGVQLLSGTSFSTPQVSGTLALLKQEYPYLTPIESYAIIALSATPIMADNYSLPFYVQGAGELNITKALNIPFTTENGDYLILFPSPYGSYNYDLALKFLKNVVVRVNYTGSYPLTLSEKIITQDNATLLVSAPPTDKAGTYYDRLIFSVGSQNYTLPVTVVSSEAGLAFNQSNYEISILYPEYVRAQANVTFPDGTTYFVSVAKGQNISLASIAPLEQGFYKLSVHVYNAESNAYALGLFYVNTTKIPSMQHSISFPLYAGKTLIFYSIFISFLSVLLLIVRREKSL
ncbi:MAG: S8 family serine peptidase [Conexivisphaerales archaeon]